MKLLFTTFGQESHAIHRSVLQRTGKPNVTLQLCAKGDKQAPKAAAITPSRSKMALAPSSVKMTLAPHVLCMLAMGKSMDEHLTPADIMSAIEGEGLLWGCCLLQLRPDQVPYRDGDLGSDQQRQEDSYNVDAHYASHL